MFLTRRTVYAVALAAALAAASVAGSAPASAAVARHAAATVAVKPVIQGYLDRQEPPPKAMQSVVHAYVVPVTWAALQPTQGGPIAANNAIDQAIARVNQPDFAKLGMVLKLRIFAGIYAPDWAKNIDGAPITYYGAPGDTTASGTLGRWWTADYGAAYADFEAKLAAKYDSVPQIREVTVSRCSTMYDESFVRNFGDSRNVAALTAAGYTTAADEQCILDSFTEHNVWQQTTSDVAFAPMPLIAKPTDSRDLTFTESAMQQCRVTLGVRCGIENNSLSSSKLSNTVFVALYAYMTKMGPPLILQTAKLSAIGNVDQVLTAAGQIGANSVELPNGYAKWSLTMMQTDLAPLMANPTP